MTMRGFAQRVAIGVAGTVVLALLGCPPQPPATVTCDSACARAVAVCSTVDRVTCADVCGRVRGTYAANLAAAASCADVRKADPGVPATQSVSPSRTGR